jgi:hypothetical protein
MEFRRDRLTWIAYALLAWFAYLQAAPGLVVGHLRDELDLSYSPVMLVLAAAGLTLVRRAQGAAFVVGRNYCVRLSDNVWCRRWRRIGSRP